MNLLPKGDKKNKLPNNIITKKSWLSDDMEDVKLTKNKISSDLLNTRENKINIVKPDKLDKIVPKNILKRPSLLSRFSIKDKNIKNKSLVNKESLVKDNINQDNVQSEVKPNKTLNVIQRTSKSPSSSLFISLLCVSLLLLFLVCGILIAILAQLHQVRIQALSNFKDISVISNPDTADVYIDNVYKGITPLIIENVNISQSRVLRIRKMGYLDVFKTIDKNNLQTQFDITLVTSSVNPIALNINKNFGDLGIAMKVTADTNIVTNVINSKCKYLKNFITDKKKCPNDDTSVVYTSYVINMPTQDGSYSAITLRPSTSGDFCVSSSQSLSDSDPDYCHKIGDTAGSKLQTVKVLNQDVDLYTTSANFIYAKSNIISNGKDFNNFYIQSERMIPDVFAQVLSTITKNA